MKTHDCRKLSPQVQQEVRLRAVHAILEEQMSQTEATRVFGVGRTSIHNWLKAYQKGGVAALKAHKRGPKHQSRLAGHQAATIVRLITDRCPDQLKQQNPLSGNKSLCPGRHETIRSIQSGRDVISFFEKAALSRLFMYSILGPAGRLF